MVEIRLLGPVEATVEGDRVDVGGVKQRTVLAVLASRSGDWVSEGQLIDAVWGEEASEGALRSLQTYVSNLRSLLDPERQGLIGRDQGRYRLNADLAAVDAHKFEETVTDDEVRVEELWEALELWRGRPLGELADDDWAGGLVAHLERLHLQATGKLMSARLAEGEHAELVEELEDLVDAHPLHEPFWGHLMLALYRSGRQADALDAYKRAGRTLGNELGIEPGPDLQDLEEKILLQDPSLAAPSRTPHNLPAERTSLIGRESEIEEVLRLLGRTRLLTLTGAGGVGKTRLAQAVARQVLDEYPDGVWFVDLAPLAEADLVMKRLAAVLDVEPPVLRPVEEVVVEAIGDRRMVFVLDNCEHLIEPAASAASALLEASHVDVLATSRETLRVDGELAWRVPSLSVPRKGAEAEDVSENESVRLFQERASAVEPSFRLDAENVDAVGSVCRDLDGIPLAVELAAARIATLTPQELHRRLDQRLALLTGGSRTGLARHRTLEAAIEWSYELLNDEERDLFNRLGLLAGPFDMNAATAVSPYEEVKTVDLVDGLVAKSLLIPEHYERRRFRMLETLRQYGFQQLQKQELLDDARNALLQWAHELTTEVGPKLMSPDQVTVTRQLDVDINSIRTAMNWALQSNQVEAGLQIATAISRYWYLRALSAEGADWYDRFLRSTERIQEETLARGLVASSGTLVRVGRWREAFDQAGTALQLLEESDNPGLLGWAYYQRGVASHGLIESEEERQLFLKAQDYFRQSGSAIGLGLAVLLENGAAWLHISPEESLKRSIELTKQMEAANVPIGIAHSTEIVGAAAIQTGDLDLALERYRQALPIYDELRVYACQAHCLDGVAMWLIETGRPDEGAVVAAGTDELRRSLSTIQAPYEKFFEELVEFRATMSEDYPNEVNQGSGMNRPELVDFAIDALRTTD